MSQAKYSVIGVTPFHDGTNLSYMYVVGTCATLEEVTDLLNDNDKQCNGMMFIVNLNTGREVGDFTVS